MSSSHRVEKLMSLTRQDFLASLAHIPNIEADAGAFISKLPPGYVRITFEPLAGTRLGGLLELPRARVVLNFTDVSEGEQRSFIGRFDLAFQRGGG